MKLFRSKTKERLDFLEKKVGFDEWDWMHSESNTERIRSVNERIFLIMEYLGVEIEHVKSHKKIVKAKKKK